MLMQNKSNSNLSINNDTVSPQKICDKRDDFDFDISLKAMSPGYFNLFALLKDLRMLVTSIVVTNS